MNGGTAESDAEQIRANVASPTACRMKQLEQQQHAHMLARVHELWLMCQHKERFSPLLIEDHIE